MGWRAGGNCKSRGDGWLAKWGVDVGIIRSQVGSRLVAGGEGLGGRSRASASFTSTRWPMTASKARLIGGKDDGNTTAADQNRLSASLYRPAHHAHHAQACSGDRIHSLACPMTPAGCPSFRNVVLCKAEHGGATGGERRACRERVRTSVNKQPHSRISLRTRWTRPALPHPPSSSQQPPAASSSKETSRQPVPPTVMHPVAGTVAFPSHSEMRKPTRV